MKYCVLIFILIAAVTLQHARAADEWDPSVLQHVAKDPVPGKLTYTRINCDAMEPQHLTGWFCIIVPQEFAPGDANNAYFLYTPQLYVYAPITYAQFAARLREPLHAGEYYLPAQLDVVSNQGGTLEYQNLKLLPCKLNMAKIRQAVRVDFEKRLDASHAAVLRKLQAAVLTASGETVELDLQANYQSDETIRPLLDNSINLSSIVVQDSIPQWQMQQFDKQQLLQAQRLLHHNYVGPLTAWSSDFKKVTIYCFDSVGSGLLQAQYWTCAPVQNIMPNDRAQIIAVDDEYAPDGSRHVSAVYSFDMETGLTSVKVWGPKEAAASALRVADFK